MYRIGEEEIQAVARVIRSKNLFKTTGTETMDCEKELREKFGVNHSILMTSGKAALISALTALGVGPGDEVIVPAYTYIATAIAVTSVGAIPVIAEIDETLTIDPADVEKKISKYTKAIIPVHMQGLPCDMDALCDIAKKHGLFIVEDACQADGGSYKGKRLGTIGEIGALSFNHYKIITSGEGGALLTNDRVLYENALIFQDSSAIAFFGDQLQGITQPQFCGNEYRTNEITAAILREQLKKLDGILFDLRKNKGLIMQTLRDDFNFIPSNDIVGDCGVMLAFSFETRDAAQRFIKSAEADGIYSVSPIDTGKHVYTHWTPIIEKRGAFNPKMDPFKMEENQALNFNCTPDACPKTLDILAKTVYISVDPDWSDDDIAKMIELIKRWR